MTRSTTRQSCSPQAPDDVVVEVADADADQIREAVRAGRDASQTWRHLPAPVRANALSDAAAALAAGSEELTDLVVREVGKPRAEARGEVARAVAIWRFFAQSLLDPDGAAYPSSDGQSWLLHRHRPHGVAALITPWNFPIAIPSWKAAPALAYGNSIVLKPAPAAPAVALRLAEYVTPFLPDGLFRVVTGDVDTGQLLVGQADVVSFTGSVNGGRAVASAATTRGIPLQAEMGGQNATIVCSDAPVEAAAATVAQAAMGYAGQKCTATSRAIVIGDPGPFVDAFVEAVRALPVGDPGDEATVVGPVITEGARQAVIDAAADARRRGGRLLTGGDATAPGWTMAPAVLDGLAPDDPVAQDEVFGPLCVVLRARDDDEAVAVANSVRYGLVSSVFTGDLQRVMEMVDRLDTGMVKVNAPTTGVDFYAPFGGRKASSIGPREQGKAAQDFYTWVQTITMTPARPTSAPSTDPSAPRRGAKP